MKDKETFLTWNNPKQIVQRAKNNYQIYKLSLILAFLFFVLIVPISAQPPTSFATGNVPGSFEDCVARAKQALELEGYGGVTRAGDKYYGTKGIHTAIIICDRSEANGRRDFHIVVASIANSGDIPGLERIKLGNRMDNPITEGTGGGGNYMGCFKDDSNRDLSGLWFQSDKMTIESCSAYCKQNGFIYAGLQYYSYCFCGNSYGKYGTTTNCDTNCAGNPNQKCGGGWANSIFKVQ